MKAGACLQQKTPALPEGAEIPAVESLNSKKKTRRRFPVAREVQPSIFST